MLMSKNDENDKMNLNSMKITSSNTQRETLWRVH